jgi:hypothetical protein
MNQAHPFNRRREATRAGYRRIASRTSNREGTEFQSGPPANSNRCSHLPVQFCCELQDARVPLAGEESCLWRGCDASKV